MRSVKGHQNKSTTLNIFPHLLTSLFDHLCACLLWSGCSHRLFTTDRHHKSLLWPQLLCSHIHNNKNPRNTMNRTAFFSCVNNSLNCYQSSNLGNYNRKCKYISVLIIMGHCTSLCHIALSCYDIPALL